MDDQLCGVIEGVKRSYAIDCAGKSGGDISITLDNQHLTLCEVEVNLWMALSMAQGQG